MPCVVHQDTTHHLGRNGEEVGPVAPAHLILRDHPEVGLVDQSGSLEGVVGTLVAEIAGREAPKPSVDERHQHVQSPLVTATPRYEQARDLDWTLLHSCVSVLLTPTDRK